MFDYQSSINRDYILLRYTQEDIFKYILKQEILLKKKCYNAPYRLDNNGTCSLCYYGDVLYFCDFANEQHHFDCFQLYTKVFNLTDDKVYQHILEHVEISDKKTSLSKRTNNNQVKKRQKIQSEIAIVKQAFSPKDLSYWMKFGITKKQLQEDGVVSVKYIRVVNEDIDVTYAPKTLCYAYTEWGTCLKIYQPLAKKERKWLTNCKPCSIGGTHTIPNQDIDETLIITKSYKDWRVLINSNCYSIWLQNEVTLPERELLLEYINRFKDIVILFDNDDTGIKNAKKLQEYIQLDNVRVVFIPFKTIKDSSDLYYHKGQCELIKFLKNNNVIQKK